MCHKLLQVYTCGHKKTVCITPCPHAIATGRQVPDNHHGNILELSRSSSVASSMTPPPTTTPLKAALLSSQGQGQQQGGNVPAFRFIVPATGQDALSVGSPASMSPTSPSSDQPSPTFSNTGTLVDAPISSPPSTFFTPADPEVDTSTVEPNFCAYYFPRDLPHTHVPCVGCYMQPKWEMQRKLWMKAYWEQHPGVTGDIEKLSGITGVRERFG